jgi:hypothetical protein
MDIETSQLYKVRNARLLSSEEIFWGFGNNGRVAKFDIEMEETRSGGIWISKGSRTGFQLALALEKVP